MKDPRHARLVNFHHDIGFLLRTEKLYEKLIIYTFDEKDYQSVRIDKSVKGVEIMKEIVDFLNNNIDKIWTLLATLIGAIISYMATTAAEKRKEKRAVQRERLKDVLIPLCASVEEALAVIDQNKDGDLLNFDARVKDPIVYLMAEKRVFLSKQQKNQLEIYKTAVKDFYKTWEDEQNTVLRQYLNWIGEKLRDCSSAPFAIDVDISISLKPEDIRIDVLEKKIQSYKKYVTGVTFIINESSDNCQSVFFHFDEEIKKLCEETIDTIYDNTCTEVFHACEIYAFLWSIDDNPIIEELTAGIKSNVSLFELESKAKKLQERLLKDIDKIAG